MQIKKKLSLQFTLMAGIIMLLFSLIVYLSSASYRRDDYFKRLEDRAESTARLLIEVEEVDANLLRKIERDNPVSLYDEKIIILDYTNSVIYSSDTLSVILYDLDLLNKIRLEGKVKTRSGEYELLGILFAEQYDRFVVLSAARDIYGFSKLRNLRVILMLLNVIFIILFFPAGWFFAGRALVPISSMVEKVEDITITSLKLRVDEGNGKDELAHLAHTFNQMLDRLETAFNVQNDFISNASHELRTPLTAITGQLSVLLMKDRSASEYHEALSKIHKDIINLNRLIDRLLLLAHASSESGKAGFRNIRIDEILWQSREELINYEKGYKISISIDAEITDLDNFKIFGDEQLLRSAFTNIMENGCKFSSDRFVSVTLGQADKKILISFTDNGSGISKADIQRIFEPFYRGRNPEKVRGHGIGLSLTRKIVEIHKGEISIKSKEGEGTTVTILLPLALI